MAAPANRSPPEAARPPTTFYFAYGSNLHLKQMKRRCPESRYIGIARLRNHRWQINERGYANVVECQGHWVDGLVYEINAADEARLDINEGVSKNAYAKSYLKVHLHRAPSTLYRRPTSWIVNNGGPTKIQRRAKQNGTKLAEHAQHWRQEVLVYISLSFVEDSEPKDEYVNRINWGIADARALGVEEDYISNCIRPFVPASQNAQVQAPIPPKPQLRPPKPELEKRVEQPAPRGQKRNASPRSKDQSPARRGQAPTEPLVSPPDHAESRPAPLTQALIRRPAGQVLRRVLATDASRPPLPPRPGQGLAGAPPLPPRPIVRYYDIPDIPVIVVEEECRFSSWSI